MKIIIGLGNPGKKYEHTRHNVGFLAVEYMRERLGGSEWEDSKFHAVISKTKDIILMKPMTFMNLSGDAVASVVNFYKLDPRTDILVISDDLDMEFAKVRYRKEGSHGGQNGLRDIATKLGTNKHSRVKIGIGRHDHMEVSDWVLSKFTKEEREILDIDVLPKVEEYIKNWLGDSI